MLKIKTTAKSSQLVTLRDIAGNNAKYKQNLATAINSAKKKGESIIASKITEELAAPKKVVTKQLKRTDRASKTKLSSTITLVASVEGSRSGRISLRQFKPRQNKKGVSYKTSKSKGRKTVLGAFQGPRPGLMKASWKGSVFKRVGASRLPIVKLFGPSPWGVYVKKNYDRKVRQDIKRELRKQIDRRIRFLKLKKSGTI